MSSAFLAPLPAGPNMQIRGKTIPNDILNSVLSSSPDFHTLHSALCVCITWKRVFDTHPKSVLSSVAHNVVGPAFPQAVRFIRYPYPEKESNSWPESIDGRGKEKADADEDEDVTDEESDEDFKKLMQSKPKPSAHNHMAFLESDSVGHLSPEERVKLETNAQIVSDLEDIFSQRHNSAKKLSAVESHRFTRALYRIMLYCELFYLPLNLDDIDAMEDNEPGILAKIKKARLRMLDEYSTPHLLEIRAVVEFLEGLIREVLDGEEEFEYLADICIATGPSVVLRAYKEKSRDVFEDALELEVMTSGDENALFGGFFSATLKKIWRKRDVDLPLDSALMSNAILGATAEGGEDVPMDVDVPRVKTCAQCGDEDELWSSANWKNRISIDFCALIQGKLGENEVEMEALVELLMSPRGSADVVLGDIYDDLLTTPEFAAWKKEESLCAACLDKLVAAHLHLWLYKRKVAGGWKATHNCWYGYNCNTQVHKFNHAKEKNHLCTPVR
ncbi:hypothetical protein R3P38DRAFT_3008450 [Favolaschia claudopus]|uniref:F-box protein n=1 Tax=Favolaschia claudopus TaxID=2862362 RepID=A0AAW0AJ78_9AGAR